MKISIKNKIILFFSLFVLLIVGGQLIFNLYYTKDYYTNYKCNVMEDLFYKITKTFDGTQESVENIATEYENKDGIDLVIRDGSENVAYATYARYFEKSDNSSNRLKPIPGFGTEGDAGLFQENPKATIEENGPSEGRSLKLQGVFSYQDTNYYVLMMLPMVAIESNVEVFTRISMMISTAVLMLGVGVSFGVSRSITKPLKEVEKVAMQVAELDFTTQANEEINTVELASLAKSINQMSFELESSINKLNQDIDYQKQIEQMRREFVANVSHEMKTPLALLQMYASNLKNRTPNIDVDYYLDTIVEETERLNSMVVSMLEISSIESGLAKMNFEKVNFSELCHNEVEKCGILMKDYVTEVKIDSDLYLNGDSTYLGQAMKNYITNAIEHAKKGGMICISLEMIEGFVKFSVYNQGKCIEERDIEHIWESFYRSDKARVRIGKNVGLGLHIVKTVVEKHNGLCKVENVLDGVLFSFELPV